MRPDIKNSLEIALGEPLDVSSVHGGGMLHTVSGRRIFLKTGPPSRAFRCEAHGLQELAKSDAVKVADVVSAGDDYIATGYLEPHSPSDDFFEDFGRALARMHCYTAPAFGFYEDNYIGANPQFNIPESTEKQDWAAFYFNRRLLFQYRLAERNGYAAPHIRSAFKIIESRLPEILAGSEEPPALLHGDLWAGNFVCSDNGVAVLIDPAVYYGHREADLAMTRLFGGFPPAFYKAYQEEYPLKPGWERREPLYRLYHVMNHLNLFGRSYLGETERILDFYAK